jgi:hypothetical protein
MFLGFSFDAWITIVTVLGMFTISAVYKTTLRFSVSRGNRYSVCHGRA